MQGVTSIIDIYRTYLFDPIRSRSLTIIIKFASYFVQNTIYNKEITFLGQTVSKRKNLNKKEIIEMKTARQTLRFKHITPWDEKVL